MRRIKELGIEMIRVWFIWNRVCPREGQFVWDEYDRFFELAEKNKLKVLVQLIYEGAPYWFENKFPECRYIDKEGRIVEFHARSSLAIGGYPGPCLDNIIARRHVEEFIGESVKRYVNRKSLYAWDVKNEVVWGRVAPCYCQATQARFHEWLKAKYQKIGRLNRRWLRNYKSFQEINMPRKGQYADMIDLYEFNQWLSGEEMKWKVELVKEIDKRHLVVSHFGSESPLSYANVMDAWSITRPLDGWGISCYKSDYHEISLMFDAVHSSALKKPWWLSEQTGGSLWHGLGQALRSNEELKSLLFLAFGCGAGGAIYWQWRPERFGGEAPQFGLTSRSGRLTSRTQVVKDVCRMFKKYSEVFDNMEENPSVGIIWEPRAYLMEEITIGKVGSPNLFGYYRALLDKGFHLKILNAREIVEEGIPKGLKVIFSPFQLIDREGLSSIIKTWVKNGGAFVAGPLYASYRHDTFTNEKVPPKDMQGLFGVEQKGIYYPDKPCIYLLPTEKSKNPITVPGYLLVETYQSRGARILGVYNNEPALTLNRYGKGFAIMVGSFVGNSYISYPIGEFSTLTDLIFRICKTVGLRPDISTTGPVISRFMKSGNDMVVFIHNFSQIQTESNIAIPGYKNRAVIIDLFLNQKIGKISNGESFRIELTPRDSRVILLQVLSAP